MLGRTALIEIILNPCVKLTLDVTQRVLPVRDDATNNIKLILQQALEHFERHTQTQQEKHELNVEACGHGVRVMVIDL